MLNTIFSSPVFGLIKNRSSCRTYSRNPLDEPQLTYFQKLIGLKRASPFEGEARFELLKLDEIKPQEKRKLGTYGFIQGAQFFLIGIMKNSKHSFEHFGFVMEELILLATEMGLGTCWVGGTFRRGPFSRQIKSIQKTETIPCISPIGIPRKPSLRAQLIKRAARSKKRRPWTNLFFDKTLDTPLTQNEAGSYVIPLEMVRLSPSASNSQPWRVIRDSSTKNFHFFLKRKKSTFQQIFRGPDYPRIDLGIAINHFHYSTQELALNGNWKFQNPAIPLPENFEYVISWFGQI